MIIIQPKTSFLGVVFDVDHDFEGPRAPKAHLDIVKYKPVTSPGQALYSPVPSPVMMRPPPPYVDGDVEIVMVATTDVVEMDDDDDDDDGPKTPHTYSVIEQPHIGMATLVRLSVANHALDLCSIIMADLPEGGSGGTEVDFGDDFEAASA